ncbi:hypothetical protein J2750_001184 [Methanococcoides alaskense]|uniref:Uncharacterized protein n=1 Tax=Methanococcoides alaskense TaxID=325778 RepID=A0AA90TZ22_9EURY|nr:hypothetical protein [Methanococcoides alaskense]
MNTYCQTRLFTLAYSYVMIFNDVIIAMPNYTINPNLERLNVIFNI